MSLNLDSSLRDALNDNERLKMCRIAKIIYDAIYEKAPDMIDNGDSVFDLKVDLNTVSLNVEGIGDLEIIVRKK